jgi:hypothetical protein
LAPGENLKRCERRFTQKNFKLFENKILTFDLALATINYRVKRETENQNKGERK